MSVRLIFQQSAIRDLRTLPAGDRERVIARLEAYASGQPADVKKLHGRNEFRLRVGNYRVLFEREGDTATVSRVAHRKDAYR